MSHRVAAHIQGGRPGAYQLRWRLEWRGARVHGQTLRDFVDRRRPFRFRIVILGLHGSKRGR